MTRRLLVLLVVASSATLGLIHAAAAAPTSCLVSQTTVRQGESFTVSGNGDTNGEFIRVVLDGSTEIGSGFTNTTGSPIHFSITATIPESTSANATHTLDVRDAVVEACPSVLVLEAEEATAEPTSSPAASASPATPATPAVPQQQQQQQQQQQILPIAIPAVVHTTTSGTLPKTGSQAQTFGVWGGVVFLAGLCLIVFSRRARLALGAVVGWRPSSEADLLLPYRDRE